MNKRKKHTLLFVVLTFLFSWLIWSLSFVVSETPRLIITIGVFVPSLVGLFVARLEGKSRFNALLKKGLIIPKNLTIYLLIFMPLPLVVGFTYLTMDVLGFATPTASFTLYEFPLVFFVILVSMGPLAEEFGWRGFLLPKVLKTQSVLMSSIIVGSIWAFWHIPLFFIDGALQASFTVEYGFTLAFIGYLFYTLLLSIFMTIVFIKSKRSVFVAILVHTVANMSIGVMPLVFSTIGALIQLTFMTLMVSIFYLLYGKKKASLNR